MGRTGVENEQWENKGNSRFGWTKLGRGGCRNPVTGLPVETVSNSITGHTQDTETIVHNGITFCWQITDVIYFYLQTYTDTRVFNIRVDFVLLSETKSKCNYRRIKVTSYLL